MNLLLVNPPMLTEADLDQLLRGGELDRYLYIRPPMGLMYLASFLRKNVPGLRVDILDLNQHMDGMLRSGHQGQSARLIQDLLAERLADFPADAIGVSVMFTATRKWGEDIAGMANALAPQARIILGGNYATNMPARYLDLPFPVTVILGEGELPMERLLKGEPEGTIPGVATRENPEPGRAEIIDDLERCGHPAWDLLPAEEYLVNEARYFGQEPGLRAANIFLSRGCPRNCTFCSSHTVHGRKVRYRPTTDIIAELDMLVGQLGANCIYVEDDSATILRARFLDVCKAIEERGYGIRFRFTAGLEANSLTPEIVAHMQRIGTDQMNIAIESGSRHVQDTLIHKHVDLEHAKEIIQHIRTGTSIHVGLFFLMGFPGETLAQMKETVDFCRSAPGHWNTFGVVIPLPGSAMYKELKTTYALTDKELETDYFRIRSFQAGSVPTEEITRLTYDANIELNFFHNRSMLEGEYGRAERLFGKIAALYPHHIIALLCRAACLNELGRGLEAEATMRRIAHQLATNSLSQEMHDRFAPCLPPGLDRPDAQPPSARALASHWRPA